MNFSDFSLEWMAWTQPVAIFFASIAIMLVVFGILQVVYPTHERRGFLPVPTTRGDRLFMSLLVRLISISSGWRSVMPVF